MAKPFEVAPVVDTMAATEYTSLAAANFKVESNSPMDHTQALTKAFHIRANLDTTAAAKATAATLGVIASIMPLVAVSILMASAGAASNLAGN